MRIFIFDPSRSEHEGASSINLGDLIIRRSIDEVFDEILPGADVVRASSHQFLDGDLLEQAVQADLVFVSGTNLLSSHVLEYNQWKLSSDPSFYLVPPQLNAILVGVGWWQYQDAPDSITRNYYNRILHPSLPHSVRDSYTVNNLSCSGVSFILNTSCPTLWKLDGHDITRRQQNRKCLFCLTDYNQQPEADNRFIELLLESYDSLIFFPQGSKDMQYAATLPSFIQAGKRILSLPHMVEAIYEILAQGELDYIGTRLHTGALSLEYGVPSLILGIDNRSQEIARDINLPVVQRGDTQAIRQWLAGGPPHGPIRLPNAEIAQWKECICKHVAAKEQSCASRGNIFVNFGCGSRWRPGWINIDFNGDNTNVFRHNLRDGLPLPDASADCIYASHCLEHFTPRDAEILLRECARALKPSGLLRIVVPDLEQVARFYLAALDAARTSVDDAQAAAKHEWMIIELIDQLCRHQSGGEVLRLWVRSEVPAEDFIISRVGVEYLNARTHCKGMELSSFSTDSLQVGTFRLGGEPHQWMYDELSLSRLLRRCGFTEIQRMDAVSSRLDGFAQYCLDTNEDGSSYKPESLYIEAFLR